MEDKKIYNVTIDYVTCCTVTVAADDEESAEKAVISLIYGDKGRIQARDFIEMLLKRCMHANIPDGFEVASVKELCTEPDLVA